MTRTAWPLVFGTLLTLSSAVGTTRIEPSAEVTGGCDAPTSGPLGPGSPGSGSPGPGSAGPGSAGPGTDRPRAPTVIWADPDIGDTGVDPALKELRIEFDSDMDTGSFSVCGGGPTYPGKGQPKWLDPRTLLIPISVEPGQTYTLSINCPSARNVRSVQGRPLEPYPIWFTTRVADAPAAAELSAEQRAGVLDALRKHIDGSYSHRSTRSLDWDQLHARLRDRAGRARSCAVLARVIARELSALRDVHVTVRAAGGTLKTHVPERIANVDRAVVQSLLTDFACDGTIVTGLYRGVPYLLIPSWSGSAEEHQRALRFIDAHGDAPGMIVDMRMNSGGDERLAQAVAARFTVRPTVYARSRVRSPDAPEGWTGPFDRAVEPDPAHRAKLHGKCVVLMGPQCMSSTESFLRMMRHAGGAKLVGEASYGSSGNPKPFDLGCGITVMLPTWVDSDIDGAPIEGRGVMPDIVVPWTPRKDDPDPVLERAAELLVGPRGKGPPREGQGRE